MWGAPRAGPPGVGARAHGGTPRGVHRSPPPPAAQGPRPLGEPQLNWTFCPGHRTRSPHGLGCSKRNSKSDAGHPIRPLETRPSLTPTLDHLSVLKVHFVLKDGTSIFPVSLRECLSAVPVLNPPSFHLSAPEGLTLSQASFLLLLPCPEARGLEVPLPPTLQAERSAPVCFARDPRLPRINLLPIPQAYLLGFGFHPSLLPTAQQIMPRFIWKTLK